MFSYLNEHLSAWLRKEHRRLLGHGRRSRQVLARIAQQRRDLFVFLDMMTQIRRNVIYSMFMFQPQIAQEVSV